jgi:hypothetical protein
MTSERWVVSDVDDYDQNTAGRPLPSLVSLHFVRSALRRRLWVCVLFAMLGLLMAIAYLLTSSTSHVANTALVLAHDPQVDSSRAMSTDVSLLTTRTVANQTIASLGLDMTPDEFLQSVTADPVSSELLSLTLTGPSSTEAVRRLDALTSNYLSFRAEQLSAQSNLLVGGMRQRIQELQGEMARLSKEIDRLANASNRGGTKLSDDIAARAYVQEQIETLQQSIQDATLRNASVVSSSRVVDPAAVDTAGIKRRIALTLASGLIGGAALGCGIVLFFAITSDRLRRRSDVAAALEAPLVSVGRIAPFPRQWLWLPHLRTLDNHRAEERQRLVRAIEMELPTPRRAGQLAVACVDNSDEVRFAVATAAADLVASGCTVGLIDLSERGSLVEIVPSVANTAGSLTVLRPRGVPALAAGPDDLTAVGRKDGSSLQFELNDVTLVFADLDASVGADHLAAWTQRVIVAVTTGRSSAEKVRTMGELVRMPGLDLRFAALLRTERTDDSSAASFDRRTPAHRRVDQDQPRLAAEEFVDHLREVSATTTTIAATAKAGEQEAAAEQTVAEEQVAREEQAAATEEQVATEKQPAEEVTVTADEKTTVAAEQPQEQTASAQEEPAKDQVATEQLAVEREPAAKEQAATTDEQSVAADDQPATDQSAADEEAVIEDQVATADQETAEEERAAAELASPEEDACLAEQLTADEQAIAEKEPAPEKQVIDVLQLAEEQPADMLQPVEEQLATEELLAVTQRTIAEEQAATGDELPAADEQLTADHEAAEKEAVLEDQVANEEQEDAEEEPAVEEHASRDEQQPAAEEQAATADQQVLATDEQLATSGLPTRDEDARLAEQLAAADEQAITEQEAAPEQQEVEQQAAGELQPVDGQPTTEEPLAGAQQTIAEDQAAAADELLAEEQPAAGGPFAPTGEEGLDEQAVTAAQHDAAAEEPTREMQAVAEEPLATKESLAQEQPAERQATEEQAAVAEDETAEEQEAVTEEQSAEEERALETAAEQRVPPNLEPAEEHVAAKETTAADQQAIDEEQMAEPDYVPDALEEGIIDGWNLYIMRYPPADGAPALESEEGEFDWSWDWDDIDDLDPREVSTAIKANFEADGHESGNGSAHGTNAEGDGRVVTEESARNGKKPTAVARTRTKSRTRRRSTHK